jgi:hypothetical protein
MRRSPHINHTIGKQLFCARIRQAISQSVGRFLHNFCWLFFQHS